jgi:hypothetical protein
MRYKPINPFPEQPNNALASLALAKWLMQMEKTA